MLNPDLASEEQNLNPPEAAGAGSAATLAFLHIFFSGMLLYGTYFLIFNGHIGHLASRNLIWQYMLPAALAIMLYFPTDPLTRVIGQISAGLGWLAIAGLFVTVTLISAAPSRQLPAVSIIQVSLNLICGLLLAFGLALGLRRMLKKRLTA